MKEPGTKGKQQITGYLSICKYLAIDEYIYYIYNVYIQKNISSTREERKGEKGRCTLKNTISYSVVT